MGNAHNALMEAERIKAWLLEQGENDPELLKDMIEGETDLLAIRDWAIGKYLHEKSFGEAIKERIENIKARKDASDKRMDKMKLLITDIMNVLEEKTYKGIEATISVKEQKPKLIVTDESKIPGKFFKIEKKLNKTDLNKAYDEGEEIEGVTLSNGGTTTTIRSK